MDNEDKEREELPVAYGDNLPVSVKKAVESPEAVHVYKKSRLGIFAIISAVSLTVATVCAVLFFLPQRKELPPDTDVSEIIEAEEWRGAFAELDIYKKCLDSTVTIQWGQGISALRWTGFVLSSDGLIATSAEPLKSQRSGRIYVMLNDGREFLVESFQLDDNGSCALIKINAEELISAQLGTNELQQGEELISVYSMNEQGLMLKSLQVEGQKDGLFLLGSRLEDIGLGAPIFDNNGTLSAFVSKNENGVLAISAKQAQMIFKEMQEKQN